MFGWLRASKTKQLRLGDLRAFVAKGIDLSELSKPALSATGPAKKPFKIDLSNLAASIGQFGTIVTNRGTVAAHPPQIAYAQAFSGGSASERYPGFEMPKQAEAAFASVPDNARGWKMQLATTPPTDGFLIKSAMQFALFNATGECLASGNFVEETKGTLKAQITGTRPQWNVDSELRIEQQKKAHAAALEAQAQQRAQLLASKPPENSPVKWLGLSVHFSDGTNQKIEPGGKLLVKASQLMNPATGLTVQLYAPRLTDTLKEMPADWMRMHKGNEIARHLQAIAWLNGPSTGLHPQTSDLLGGEENHDLKLKVPLRDLPALSAQKIVAIMIQGRPHAAFEVEVVPG